MTEGKEGEGSRREEEEEGKEQRRGWEIWVSSEIWNIRVKKG